MRPSWRKVFSGSTVGTITMEYFNVLKSVLCVNVHPTPCFDKYQKLSSSRRMTLILTNVASGAIGMSLADEKMTRESSINIAQKLCIAL